MKNEEKIIILGEKCSLDKKEREKGLRMCGYGVECTSIGGDADKNLLINKGLARLVGFLS
ncbi:hypothetical protein [Acinetobacter baylyi]|uniref:hypothetical protein n=1 Tax=Acinetobacter baylyi TaxID=202950 RepID=UPI000479B74D|nr:hypothetical protein [Acinetobacter baylyi]MAK32026.1 hypothetical protein [Acinetobacter sp.]KAF2372812.1 hypothetical protein BSL67_12055 [Acinetobacter baylyi]KAF2382161.1 hypothetical protein BSN82_13810 [Acinetobacter baylyi]KAF2385125.1 hypothetical protein BSN84_16540 [Acinetobacter baylyi]UXJ58260.1 hypothetical protein N5P16_04415 [Acinetobacter baylyi]